MRPSSLAFWGAATVSNRSFAAARSVTSLFLPATIKILPGPKAVAATRFPVPSTLKIQPLSNMALAEQQKQSAQMVRRRKARFASRSSLGQSACLLYTSLPQLKSGTRHFGRLTARYRSVHRFCCFDYFSSRFLGRQRF